MRDDPAVVGDEVQGEGGREIGGDPVERLGLEQVDLLAERGHAGDGRLLPEPEARREQAEAQIASALGGRIAEEVFFGRLTTGAGSDIKHVSRIARAMVMTDPPLLDRGEVTDKGSINQRAVLKHREATVAAMHAGTAAHVAVART